MCSAGVINNSNPQVTSTTSTTSAQPQQRQTDRTDAIFHNPLSNTSKGGARIKPSGNANWFLGQTSHPMAHGAYEAHEPMWYRNRSSRAISAEHMLSLTPSTRVSSFRCLSWTRPVRPNCSDPFAVHKLDNSMSDGHTKQPICSFSSVLSVQADQRQRKLIFNFDPRRLER